MKGKSILLSVLLLAIISCNKENEVRVPEHLKKNVSAIAGKKYITDTTLFIPFDDDYKTLIKNASVEELTLLTDHNSPNVRLYAFKALDEKGYKNIREIFYRHMNDIAIVNTYNGACIYDSSHLNYHMLDVLSPGWESTAKFTTAEYDSIYKKLDSINHP